MEVATTAAPAMDTVAAQGSAEDMSSGRPVSAETKEVASMAATVALMEATMAASMEVITGVATEAMGTREAASTAGTSSAIWLKMVTEAIPILETPRMVTTRVAVPVARTETLATEVTKVAKMVLEATEVPVMAGAPASMEAIANARPTPAMVVTKEEAQGPVFRPAGPLPAGRSSAMHARPQRTKLP